MVVQDEETGAWYQHKGRDFKVPLVNGHKKGSTKWPGSTNHYSFVCLDTFTSITHLFLSSIRILISGLPLVCRTVRSAL